MQDNDHTCLLRCINTCWVPGTMFEHLADGLVFKQLLRDSAKNMCDPNSGLKT